jgi:hypothetical protein
MAWSRLLILGVLLVLGAVLYLGLRHPAPPPDRGPAGIAFVIPAGYPVRDLGETTPARAAGEVLHDLEGEPRAAVTYTHDGDRVQLLADPAAETVEERIMGGQGTVHRVVWPDSVRARLRWGAEHGDFAVPGLPPPSTRNPYH